jgi:hypothetical protein
MGRPDGKIKASLVSTFRLGLMTTVLPVSVCGFGFAFTERTVRVFGFFAIV